MALLLGDGPLANHNRRPSPPGEETTSSPIQTRNSGNHVKERKATPRGAAHGSADQREVDIEAVAPCDEPPLHLLGQGLGVRRQSDNGGSGNVLLTSVAEGERADPASPGLEERAAVSAA